MVFKTIAQVEHWDNFILYVSRRTQTLPGCREGSEYAFFY
jgi:hypothetical protein